MRALGRFSILSAALALLLLCGYRGVWADQAATESDVKTESVAGRRWAVLVGVNEYAELQDLRFCVADARRLRDQLIASGFPEQNVFLLVDGAARQADLPFRANIQRRIEAVMKVARKDDLVLVAFSGHGVHLDGKSYFCPAEASLDSPETTMVPLDLIYRQLEASAARQKLLLVDACRNDPRPPGERDAAAHKQSLAGLAEHLKTLPAGITALSSAAAGQVSWEDQKLGHGVFMYYLIEGLSGKADEAGNRDGVVSLLELYNYAYTRTTDWILRNREGYHQTPELLGKIVGDWVLAERLAETLADPLERVIELALAEARSLSHDTWKARALARIALIDAKAANLERARTTLAEASQNAAIEEVAAAQAELGDSNAAMQTVRSIESDTDKAWALRRIAVAQASSGGITAALHRARSIENRSQRAWAFGGIAVAQAELGDIKGALQTAGLIQCAYRETEALRGIAVAQAKLGAKEGARTTIVEAMRIARSVEDIHGIAHTASVQAIMGDSQGAQSTFAEAFRLVRSVPGSVGQDHANRYIATAQAKAGDIVGAQKTAALIRNVHDKADALRAIAVAQAKAGDIEGALETAAFFPTPDRSRRFCTTTLRAVATAQGGNIDEALQTARSATSAAARVRAFTEIARAILASRGIITEDSFWTGADF